MSSKISNFESSSLSKLAYNLVTLACNNALTTLSFVSSCLISTLILRFLSNSGINQSKAYL